MFRDIDCDSGNQGTANQEIDSFKSFGNTFVEGDLAYRKSVRRYLDMQDLCAYIMHILNISTCWLLCFFLVKIPVW